MDDKQLTDKQIENWRKVLSHSLGPYAFMMTREEVQRIRNKMQNDVDNISENETGE